MRTRSFTLLALLLVAGPVVAQQEPTEQPLQPGEVPYTALLTQEQRMAFAEHLSGKEALRHIERLSRYHRLAPSGDLDAAMRTIALELRAAGLEDVQTTTYKSDGTTTWWVEPAPPAWTCDAAELWIEKPERRQLADWSAEPIRLATYSTSCDVTAEVVEVTEWTPELDLKGKIVLTRGDARTLNAQAAKAGAVGLLLAPPVEPESKELRAAVYPSTFDPAPKAQETNLFAFNISEAEAEAIRAWLDADTPVRVSASIKNARTAPSRCPIVSGRIGPSARLAKRVVLMAEVSGPRPGANGLSGAGALLSLARTYKALVEDGVLKPPSRTVEFLFVPDVHGACAYVEQHREDLEGIVAVIHLGIVGTDTERGPGGGLPLQIDDGGWLVPSCVPYLALSFGRTAAQPGLIDVAGTGAPLSLQMHARGPVAAHSVFLCGTVGRPAVSLSFFPDPSTWTSIDTADRLDATALKRTMYMALGTAYALATPEQPELQRFGLMMPAYLQREVGGCSEVFLVRVRTAPPDRLGWFYYLADTIMKQNKARVLKTFDSLTMLTPPGMEEYASEYGQGAEEAYSSDARMVGQIYRSRIQAQRLRVSTDEFLEKEARLRSYVPSMRWKGPITEGLLRRRAPEVFPVPEALDVTTLLALVDGTRSLFDIWAEHEALKWVGLPYPLTPEKQVVLPPTTGPDETFEFLRRCAKAGIIHIGKP